jgi:hypothetical protein
MMDVCGDFIAACVMIVDYPCVIVDEINFFAAGIASLYALEHSSIIHRNNIETEI